MLAIEYKKIDAEDIELNRYEVSRRLNVSKDFEMEEINECLKKLKKVTKCGFSSVCVPVKYLEEGHLDLGFGVFKSDTLTKNLKGCPKAFIFAVTLGMEVDRLLNKLSRLSPSQYFITDALASALADAAADKAEEILKNGLLCRPRFSPGFGDLSLDLQPRILGILNAQKLLGITINTSRLMSPKKSVTAIMGIKNE